MRFHFAHAAILVHLIVRPLIENAPYLQHGDNPGVGLSFISWSVSVS